MLLWLQLTKEFGSRLGEERKKLQDALDKKDREISDLDMRCQQQEQTVSGGDLVGVWW